MYHDSNGKNTSTAVIPIPDMISGGGVTFFGEYPRFSDDPIYNKELRNKNIRKLSR